MPSLITRFSAAYLPLLSKFIADIKNIDLEKMPEPHLPVYGRKYENASRKILFMGWETRGSKGLKEFTEAVKTNPRRALFGWEDDFDELAFVYWRANFNRDFWSFNLRFLAKLHKISDWRILYKDPFKYEDVLSSFAWANAESIERYHVTAQGNDVKLEDWQKVKEASKIFDDAKLIFSTLEPNVVILMHWTADETTLLKGLEIEYVSEIHPDYLLHYKIKSPDMHLFWTKHPVRLHYEGVDYNSVIEEIVMLCKTI